MNPMNAPKKPTIETCAALLKAATTAREISLAIRSAARHGYTIQELEDELAKPRTP